MRYNHTRVISTRQLVVAIVDDEESVRRALERLLRSVGMTARVFATGTEFLAEYERLMPDCLVLDLHMPGMSGFEIMNRLQGRLPVVVITGQDSPENEMRAVGAGAGAYLSKPVQDHHLIDAIHSVTVHPLPTDN